MERKLLALLVLSLPSESLELSGRKDDCPRFCSCYTWYSLRWASCSGRYLYSIDTGLSGTVQALDMSNNSISIVGDFEFQKLGLTQLKYLNLSDNAISEVGLTAFGGLTDLTILDLSRNHLNYLLPHTFADNKNMRILRLTGNNFNQHVPFLENPSITELNLAACRLSYLPHGAFSGLKQLRILDLSENSIIQLEEATLRVLPYLRILSIKNNPWTCGTREMQSLQRYLAAREIRHEASLCLQKASPRISKKKFEKLRVSPLEPKNSAGVILPENRRTGTGWVDEKSPEITRNSSNVIKVRDSMNIAWFVCAMSFIAGLAVGILSTYLLLRSNRPFPCRVRSLVSAAARGRSNGIIDCANPSAQRISLLRNIWSDSSEELGSQRMPVCPGTPPPPYHDVILHGDLYPVR